MNHFRLIACGFVLVGLVGWCGCGAPKVAPPVAAAASQNPVTLDRVCSIAAELMAVERGKVNGQTSLADLAADELDFVELVMELEETFDVSIPDDAAEQLLGTKDWQQGMKNVTLEKLTELVQKQQQQRPAR